MEYMKWKKIAINTELGKQVLTILARQGAANIEHVIVQLLEDDQTLSEDEIHKLFKDLMNDGLVKIWGSDVAITHKGKQRLPSGVEFFE